MRPEPDSACIQCEHIFDEHEMGGFFNPCAIEDCDCDDYLWDEVFSD